jgi:hypothetical protein
MLYNIIINNNNNSRHQLMPITTLEALRSHPKARLIPETVFADVLSYKINEIETRLIEAENTDALLQMLRSERLVSENDQWRIWHCIIHTHPKLREDQLWMIVNDIWRQINQRILEFVAIAGKEQLIDRLIQEKQLVHTQLQAIAKANNSAAFRGAAENGHLTVINKLLVIAPDTQAMAEADNYGAFHWATKNGQLTVVNRLFTYPTAIYQGKISSITSTTNDC